MFYNPFRIKSFEWDEEKNLSNIDKHGICFEEAQLAFADEKRIIIEDKEHGAEETRYFCMGKIENRIVTVRFTHRGSSIRIYGAGVWRKGKKIYEKENCLQR